MNLNKESGIKELDALIESVNKTFGKDFSGGSWDTPEAIPTGSIALDQALRIGGFPKGRIVEIYGEESSGKTTLALCVMASAQKIRKEKGITDKRDLIIDVEWSLSEPFIAGFGIDLDQVIWVRPEKAEEALEIACTYPKSGAIDVVLFDSVDAAQNERQLSRSVGETDVGGISKDMSFTLRQISKVCAKQDTTYIFINQIRANPGITFGNSEVTPGGNALKFYSTLRIRMLRNRPSKDIPDAFVARPKIVKTKMGIPYKQEIAFEIRYAKGIDPYADLVSVLKENGFLRLAGQAVFVKPTPNAPKEEESRLAVGGRAGAIFELKNNPELFKELKENFLNYKTPTISEREEK